MKNTKHKKTFLLILLAGILSAGLCLPGCSIGKDVEQEKAYRSEGIAAYEAGDYATAVEKFDLALEEANGDDSSLEFDITCYKAKALLESGDPEAAIAIYDTMLEEDSAASNIWYLRGCASLAAGRIEQADTDFQRAVQNAPEDYEQIFAIYQVFKDADQPEKADESLRLALQIEGDSKEDLCRKGYVCYLLGEIDQANDYLSQAIEKGSDQAILYQGMIFAKTGRTEEASDMFAQYYDANADDEEAVLDLAAAAQGGGMSEDAIRYYKALLEMEGADLQAAKKGLIAAYESTGDYETAYVLLEDYLQSWPEDEAAQKEMVFVQTRR